MSWWNIFVTAIASIGSVIAAMTVILKPIRSQMDSIVVRELEKKENETRMTSLESWTKSQQEDMMDLNRGMMTMARAVEALLDHAIEKQGGNGKCHRARDEVELFLTEKAFVMKSHK